MPASRRRLLTASFALSTPFIRSAAAARQSLTFAGYGGLFQDRYEPAVVAPFERAHPETGVFYQAVSTGTQTLALLRRQRERPQMDVVLLDLASARAATDEGLLEPLSPASMPVLTDLAPGTRFPGVAGPALFSEPLVLLFDAARVRPPSTWTGLWGGPEDKSIAIPAPPDSAGIAFTFVAARLFGGGNDQRSVRDGIVAIAQLASRVSTWDPAPDVYRLLSEGGTNAKLGVGWNMPAQVQFDRVKGRLGVVFPDDGTISRVTTVNLVKGSRQPEAARMFIAHLLSAESQQAMVEQTFLGPVNAKARYQEAALLRTANTPARVGHAMPVDWVAVGAMRDDIIRHWREIVPGSG
jgi:putative spermidine/putrescine transport system substrate-binding protein